MCIVPKTPANFCFLIWFWKLLNNWIIGWLVKTCRQIRSHSFCADYRYFIRLSTNRLLITHTIINWISFSESLLKQKSQLRKCQTFTAVNGCHKCCIYGTWRAPHTAMCGRNGSTLSQTSSYFLFVSWDALWMKRNGISKKQNYILLSDCYAKQTRILSAQHLKKRWRVWLTVGLSFSEHH